MMPSTTRRSSRKGRPRRPAEDGSNGWMRAHCPSVKTEVRDTPQASRLSQAGFRRHALVPQELGGLQPLEFQGVFFVREVLELLVLVGELVEVAGFGGLQHQVVKLLFVLVELLELPFD